MMTNWLLTVTATSKCSVPLEVQATTSKLAFYRGVRHIHHPFIISRRCIVVSINRSDNASLCAVFRKWSRTLTKWCLSITVYVACIFLSFEMSFRVLWQCSISSSCFVFSLAFDWRRILSVIKGTHSTSYHYSYFLWFGVMLYYQEEWLHTCLDYLLSFGALVAKAPSGMRSTVL